MVLGAFLDSIPGVGHAKGVLHLVSGDIEGAKRSMYEASRSTAVIAGGAAGAIVGGPLGIAAGAAAAGAASDALCSVVTQQPQGLVSGVTEIVFDIANGEVPVTSTLKTCLIVGGDVVGGVAGPTVGNCAAKAMAASTAKKMVIDISAKGATLVTRATLSHGIARSGVDLIDDVSGHNIRRRFGQNRFGLNSRSSSRSSYSSSSSQNTQASTNSESSTSSTTRNSTGTSSNKTNNSSGTNSGSNQPPNNNQNNNNNNNQKTLPKNESHWDKFLKIFNVTDLKDIIIKGKKIFENINSWQKKELRDFIVNVNNNFSHLGLENIVKITLELLSHVTPDQVTSHNFVTLAKFVLAYLCEELTEQHEAFRKSTENFITSLKNQAKATVENIRNSTIINIFRTLMSEITELSGMINPKFVNVIAAVYHYFKHKYVEVKDLLFTPADYFILINSALNTLMAHSICEQLMRDGVKRIVYQKYYADIGRRLMIVIKYQGDGNQGCWNTVSCYFEDDVYDGDEDGEEWINGEKI